MLKKIITFLVSLFKFLPIFLLKKPFKLNFFLHALMPITGYIHFVDKKSLNSKLLILCSMFLLGIPICLYYSHYIGVLRCLQSIGMVLLCDFLFTHFSKQDFIRLSKIILILSLVYIFLEMLIFGPGPMKSILPGVIVPRSLGMIGESNFTAICIALLSLFCLYFDSKKFFFVGVLSLLFLSSRISIIIIIIGLIPFLFKKFKSLQRHLVYALSLSPFSFPIIIYLIEKLCDDSTKLIIEKVVNGRYVISACYLKMFLENPLGIGFFRGRLLYKSYAYKGTTLTQNGLFDYTRSFPSMQYEQHNLFMQTLVEFGIWGYLLFLFFVIRILREYKESNFFAYYLFGVCLVGFSSLNGYAEFVLYFVIAFVMKELQEHSKQSSIYQKGSNAAPAS